MKMGDRIKGEPVVEIDAKPETILDLQERQQTMGARSKGGPLKLTTLGPIPTGPPRRRGRGRTDPRGPGATQTTWGKPRAKPKGTATDKATTATAAAHMGNKAEPIRRWRQAREHRSARSKGTGGAKPTIKPKTKEKQQPFGPAGREEKPKRQRGQEAAKTENALDQETLPETEPGWRKES